MRLEVQITTLNVVELKIMIIIVVMDLNHILVPKLLGLLYYGPEI